MTKIVGFFSSIFLFQRNIHFIRNMASAGDSTDMSDLDEMLNDDELSQVEEVGNSGKNKDKGILRFRIIF